MIVKFLFINLDIINKTVFPESEEDKSIYEEMDTSDNNKLEYNTFNTKP